MCYNILTVFSDGWVPDDDYKITERQWYRDAAASDSAVITEPYIDALTGEMVITIAKAYKRGGNVACVTAADMFLTEVSSIIIHRSEELMLPYVDLLRQRTLHQLPDTISAVSGEKSEDGVTPHAEGLRLVPQDL
ncbi:MAG: cache domain-containing protein [Oscillospiraceae bacterium]